MIDLSNLPNSVVREVLDDIVAAETALPDQFFGTQIRDITTMSGSIPRHTLESGIARGLNGGLRPLEEPKELKSGGGSLSYEALAYVGYSFVSDEEANDFKAFGVDALQKRLSEAVRDANTALNVKMQTLLTSTTANTEADVTGLGNGNAAWDDGGTASTPVTDLYEITEELCPGANFYVMGRKVANALMTHPDVGAGTLNFSNGVVTDDVLKAWLASNFGLENGIILKGESAIYDTSAQGQTSAIGYYMPTGMWVGHKRALVMVHPANDEQGKSEITRFPRKRGYEVQFNRYDDLQIISTNLGVTVTNAAS